MTRFLTLPLLVLSALAWAGGARAQEVDLKSDFASLAENQYFVRVGVQADTSAGRVVCDGDFVLHDRTGQILYSGRAGEPIGFRAANAHPGQTVVYYLLARLPADRRSQAEAVARKARERLEMPVSVRVDPRDEVTPSPFGEPPDGEPGLAVAAGPFLSRADAKAHERRIFMYYKAEYYQTVDSQAEGRVRAVSGDGKVVAEADIYIGMRPRSRTAVTRLNGIKSLYRGWNRPAAWADNRAYRGLVEVRINPRGRLSMINRVFIEHYLYGVVPAEIGGSAPFEMKKVQAVISRSKAILHLRENRHAGWHYDLCDQQDCQVYKGYLDEDSQTNAAVDATRGQVLVYENHIIDAVYSRSCGGVTAANNHIWGGAPRAYLQSKFDSLSYPGHPDLSHYEDCEKWINSRPPVHCNPDQNGCPSYLRKAFRWQRTYTRSQLRANLHRLGKTKGFGYGAVADVTNLRVLERTPGGRVVAIQVDTGKRSLRITGADKVRRALGSHGNWLPSAFLVLDREFDKKGVLKKVMIKGAGEGHGVGLCQTGAYLLACQGTNYVTILKHYYTGAEVYKIYE